MPISSNNLIGLVILSVGVLGVIIGFLVQDRKKYLISLVLSLFIVSVGGYYYISLGLRQWRLNRRISQLQEQQRVNFQAFQDRLRQNQPKSAAAEKTGAPATRK